FENYDLFGVKFDENGLAGDIFRLTNTESNESALFGYMDYYSNLCCWVSEGNIYTAELQVSQDTLKFTDIEIIDSGDCYNPVCQEHYIAWRKVENNESHIYYSEKNWSTNQWSYPAAIIDTGNNINLALSISVPELSGWGYNLCWQAEDKIYFSDLDGDNIYSPEIPGIEKYYEPTAFNMIWLTDYISDLYSFAGGTESQRDIYIVDEDVSNYVLNITDDPYINKNPRLFIGRNVYGYDDYEIIIIWQTEINGYDVLYSSYALYNVVIGSIDDSKMSQLDIYPNPVTSIAKIKINLTRQNNEQVSISILNNQGKKVDEIRVERNPSNEININWNKGDLPGGIYYLVIKTEKEQISEKFIIL
ncbi:MAG: T9SS type A sorting domain-containing protein, partial [Bacteroidales bacterium]|nr:T9SS type A sorting domain-containing protein [Bacteroidales bacterium]